MAQPEGARTLAPDAEDSRRGRRRQEMRERVFRAAIELFVARGYDATTMEDIADAADVARATVFNHFERKVAFLEEWAAHRRRTAIAAVHADQLDEHTSKEILTRYMEELARLSTKSRSETVAVMGAAVRVMNLLHDPPLGRELATYVARGAQRHEIRADVDASHAGRLLAIGYFATLTSWIAEDPEPYDLQVELLRLLDLLFTGLTEPSAPGR